MLKLTSAPARCFDGSLMTQCLPRHSLPMGFSFQGTLFSHPLLGQAPVTLKAHMGAGTVSVSR